MFSEANYKLTSSYGFNFRFGYFCIHNLFICNCFELQNVEFQEFVLVQLPTDLVLWFRQGVSKNQRINVTKCFVD